MNTRTLFYMIGNRDVAKGKEFAIALALRLRDARQKHPLFAEGRYEARGVIADEIRELEQAVEKESPERQADKALDVATTAARFWMGEHEVKE